MVKERAASRNHAVQHMIPFLPSSFENQVAFSVHMRSAVSRSTVALRVEAGRMLLQNVQPFTSFGTNDNQRQSTKL
jgi:hypothetical protein